MPRLLLSSSPYPPLLRLRSPFRPAPRVPRRLPGWPPLPPAAGPPAPAVPPSCCAWPSPTRPRPRFTFAPPPTSPTRTPSAAPGRLRLAAAPPLPEVTPACPSEPAFPAPTAPPPGSAPNRHCQLALQLEALAARLAGPRDVDGLPRPCLPRVYGWLVALASGGLSSACSIGVRSTAS